ncbi:hypothetical protein BU16DRAFT_386548 [Lophium mytilinum]|uniref:Uncharacterized protein n=1 Tax=Lophium mytilinum TaxID=390894 RepID=A0A6A6QTN1_9PEZI|nr:hypothetical protein BU16DRAFT_386548 [Lophium mytilinum]
MRGRRVYDNDNGDDADGACGIGIGGLYDFSQFSLDRCCTYILLFTVYCSRPHAKNLNHVLPSIAGYKTTRLFARVHFLPQSWVDLGVQTDTANNACSVLWCQSRNRTLLLHMFGSWWRGGATFTELALIVYIYFREDEGHK